MTECAACGEPAEGNYDIHRDGFGVGPEVPLCDACGSKREPTCEEIWAAIRLRRARLRVLADPHPIKCPDCGGEVRRRGDEIVCVEEGGGCGWACVVVGDAPCGCSICLQDSNRALTLGPAYAWAMPAGVFDVVLADGSERCRHRFSGGETRVDEIEIRAYREPSSTE